MQRGSLTQNWLAVVQSSLRLLSAYVPVFVTRRRLRTGTFCETSQHPHHNFSTSWLTRSLNFLRLTTPFTFPANDSKNRAIYL